MPTPFRNRYEAERSRRHGSTGRASEGHRATHVYGPPRYCASRVARDRRYWSYLYVDFAKDDEKAEKEKQEKEGQC